MIKARIRLGAGWGDACILNVSPHGLGLQAASPPERGAYVEVRRGRHVLIGRVAWSKGHRFGLRTQDIVAVEAVIREPDLSEPNGEGPAIVEPRPALRPPEQRAGRSRELARTLQFAFVMLLGASAAIIAFNSIQQALARPLTSVSASLRGK